VARPFGISPACYESAFLKASLNRQRVTQNQPEQKDELFRGMESFDRSLGIILRGHLSAQPVELAIQLGNFHGAEQGRQDEPEKKDKDEDQKKRHWRSSIAEEDDLHGLGIVDAENEEHQKNNGGKKDAKSFHGRLSSKACARSS
jgi:hypothetical protein